MFGRGSDMEWFGRTRPWAVLIYIGSCWRAEFQYEALTNHIERCHIDQSYPVSGWRMCIIVYICTMMYMYIYEIALKQFDTVPPLNHKPSLNRALSGFSEGVWTIFPWLNPPFWDFQDLGADPWRLRHGQGSVPAKPRHFWACLSHVGGATWREPGSFSLNRIGRRLEVRLEADWPRISVAFHGKPWHFLWKQ